MLETHAQAELKVAGQVRLRIGERSEVRIVDRRVQAAKEMAVANVESGGAELDDVLLAAAEVEVLAGGEILTELIRLANLRDRRRHVTEGEVGRLDERRPVQVGTVRICRIKVRVHEYLA